MPSELYHGKSNSKIYLVLCIYSEVEKKINGKENRKKNQNISTKKKAPPTQMCEAIGPKTRPAENAIGFQDLQVTPLHTNPENKNRAQQYRVGM